MRARLAGLGVLTAVLLAACDSGGSVYVAPPTPEPSRGAVDACRELGKVLPDHVDGQPLRAVTPVSPFTSAWGAPPIELRCGVVRPAALRADSQLTTVNGVDWFAEQLGSAWRFTTYGRVAYVQVTVPQRYAPQVNALVDLAGAIQQTVRLQNTVP